MKKESISVAVCGGDKRQRILAGLLKAEYPDTTLCLYDSFNIDKLQKANVVILPTVAVKGNYLNAPHCDQKVEIIELLQNATACKLLFAGTLPDEIKAKLKKSGIKVNEYASSECFKQLNAIPTAEVAVALAAESSDRCIWGSKVLVIGCGAIGKRLAKTLSRLDASVTVTARKATDKAYITAQNYGFCETASAGKAARDYDFIFNTVPARVLSPDEVIDLSESSVYIELASAPYGIDIKEAGKASCKVVIGSGLPGKYSPVTAAKIIKNEIVRTINEGDLL